jgi:hypothetical protein
MSVVRFVKKFQLILFLSFVVISMGIIKLVYGYKGNENQLITPTPNVNTQQISPEPKIIEAVDSAKIKLPYKIEEVDEWAKNNQYKNK